MPRLHRTPRASVLPLSLSVERWSFLVLTLERTQDKPQHDLMHPCLALRRLSKWTTNRYYSNKYRLLVLSWIVLVLFDPSQTSVRPRRNL